MPLKRQEALKVEPTSNLTYGPWKPAGSVPLDEDGNSGDNNAMESRLSRLESAVEGIRQELGTMKYWIVGTAIAIIGVSVALSQIQGSWLQASLSQSRDEWNRRHELETLNIERRAAENDNKIAEQRTETEKKIFEQRTETEKKLAEQRADTEKKVDQWRNDSERQRLESREDMNRMRIEIRDDLKVLRSDLKKIVLPPNKPPPSPPRRGFFWVDGKLKTKLKTKLGPS